MNVDRMRIADRWLGIVVCVILTVWRKCTGWWRERAVSRPPGSILFIKLAEQGSTVLAQSALRAAVERVGRDKVFFLAFAENRPILDLLEIIPRENVIPVEAGGILKTIWNAWRAIVRIRRLRIDAVIDLEFFARSTAALAYLSGARYRVGYHGHTEEAPYRGDLLTHRVPFNTYLHTSQTFEGLVAALDEPADRFPIFSQTPPPLRPLSARVTPTADEQREIRDRITRELGRAWDGPLLLLNANASDLMPLRRWPADRYVTLAQRLLARYADAVVAFTGAPSEATAIEPLVAQVGSPRCIHMAGKTTLRELLVLYTLSDVLVTNDSGPAHFSTLTPVDAIVLFGPETPQLFAAPSPRTHVLWAGLACSPCINAFNNRRTVCRDNVCMSSLTVDAVFERTCAVLDSRRRSSLPHRAA